jgi:hypothetical protein
VGDKVIAGIILKHKGHPERDGFFAFGAKIRAYLMETQQFIGTEKLFVEKTLHVRSESMLENSIL